MPERGKPQNFSDDQMKVLLQALREYVASEKAKRGNFTQQDLGDDLGMSQQNAGRLLEKDGVGLSYQSATRIAILKGYSGVDDLFRTHGVFDQKTPDAKPSFDELTFPNQRQAVSIARSMGATETAIKRVVERCSDPFYRDRKVRWWVDEVMRECDAEREYAAQMKSFRAMAETEKVAAVASKDKPKKKAG